jgi:hypothetical protein
MLPCGLLTRLAGTGQRKVLEVQPFEVPLESGPCHAAFQPGSRPFDARLQCRPKPGHGHRPSPGLRLTMETFDEIVRDPCVRRRGNRVCFLHHGGNEASVPGLWPNTVFSRRSDTPHSY